MKQKWISVLLLLCLVLVGCGQKKSDDYSKVPFAGISWTRETENDTETIRFGKDGSFGYSCGCGNPVDEADLVESYTYDADTKTVHLVYDTFYPGAITEFTVVSCNDRSLAIDYGGELRVFYCEE